ncbi:TAXI family TRAP transporter solute-binding subunit [Natronorubrum tibetense]|uniref:TRAP transporter solute receptor, TAXI family protein n=1 Tax=Natronorubrum tibetense GA33 TaxID=1114856 RepID=L9W398_9EURY|nr:TAXI family TRAP transporter solute-binding subunit [Natronorubrum tibetense]ELY43766.1 TRAP transporter solute receptor, TAXI family protein [Natronorubrum tibetense GA33]
MVERPTGSFSEQTRRSFLAATGVGTATALAGCFGEDDDDSGYERISVSFSEQGGALNEGQLDVGVGTMMNFSITPGWLQEAMASVDEFRVLDITDETNEAWQGDETLLIEDLDTDEMEGADNDDVDVPGEIPCPSFSYNFVSQAALDYDVVYTYLETMWEVREELADAFGIFAFHNDPEFWVQNAYEGIPFHPAAADFYEEELDVWSDEFERADEPDDTLEVDTIRMKTSEQGTTGHAANEALASVMNENLDDLSIEAQTSDGTEENIGDIADESIEMGFLQNWTAREFREDVEPFDQLDFEMTQIFHYYDLPWFFITNNMDLETLSDIESDMTVSPTPSGSGTAPGLERALEHALDN